MVAVGLHRATVDGFWMDRHPVTVAQFRRFVAATGYATVAERPLTAADYPDANPGAADPGPSAWEYGPAAASMMLSTPGATSSAGRSKDGQYLAGLVPLAEPLPARAGPSTAPPAISGSGTSAGSPWRKVSRPSISMPEIDQTWASPVVGDALLNERCQRHEVTPGYARQGKET